MRRCTLFFVLAGSLAIGTTAFTATLPNEMINATPNKPKSMETNAGAKNLQNTAPVKDSAVHPNSWCEEDCGKQLKPGTKKSNVQK